MKKLCLFFLVVILGGGLNVFAQGQSDPTSLSITVENTIPDSVLVTSLEELTIFSESEDFVLNEKLKELKNLRSLSVLIENREFTIPSWIGELTQLEELYIKWTVNQISPEIFKLKNLKALSIIGSYSNIPSGISSLSQLQYLNLSSPNLFDINDEVFDIVNLGFLGITGTNVKTISPKVSQLKYMEYLDLGDNVITRVPDLSACKNLIEVNLHENKISPFEHQKIKSSLGQMTVVKYDYNFQKFSHPRKYKSIISNSDNTSKSVRKALSSKVEVLDLSNCENLGKELAFLNKKHKSLQHIKAVRLSGNNLEEIPLVVFKLKGLKELYVDDNKLQGLTPMLFEAENIQILSISKNPMPMLSRELLYMHQLSKLIVNAELLNQFILNSINENIPNVQIVDIR